MGRKKIAYIVSSLNYGGVESFIVELANCINRKKFEPYVFTFKKNGPLKTKLKPDVKVFELLKRDGNDPILPFVLGKLLKRERIDVIHSNNWSTYLEAISAKYLSGCKKIIHTQHGIEMNQIGIETKWKRKMRNMVRGGLACFTDKLVVVSKATKKFVCEEWGVRHDSVCLIYNGIDLTKFCAEGDNKSIKKKFGLNTSSLTIGSVGRVARVKNYGMLIDSFYELSRKYNDLQLIFIGDGDQLNNLKTKTMNFRLNDRVKFLGQRQDVHNLLAAIDIFVLPSYSEGLSLAVLEAMACSIPVVLTNVGGNPEIIGKNKYGILIDNNNKEQLTYVLNILIRNEQKRKEFGRLGKLRIHEMFNLQDMIRKYENFY